MDVSKLDFTPISDELPPRLKIIEFVGLIVMNQWYEQLKWGFNNNGTIFVASLQLKPFW